MDIQEILRKKYSDRLKNRELVTRPSLYFSIVRGDKELQVAYSEEFTLVSCECQFLVINSLFAAQILSKVPEVLWETRDGIAAMVNISDSESKEIISIRHDQFFRLCALLSGIFNIAIPTQIPERIVWKDVSRNSGADSFMRDRMSAYNQIKEILKKK